MSICATLVADRRAASVLLNAKCRRSVEVAEEVKLVQMPPDDDALRRPAGTPASPPAGGARAAADTDATLMDLSPRGREAPARGQTASDAVHEAPSHDALTQLDLPSPALSWHPVPNAPAYPGGYPPAWHAPGARPATKPLLAAADSWGDTSLAFNANTAAGISYLFGWISGLLIYFNERTNRYVRFHALQSILFSAVAVTFGVLAGILAALAIDLGRVTHLLTLSVLGGVIAVYSLFVVVVIWSWLMIAAWTGHRAQIPVPVVGAVIRRYAERYAAPPVRQPTR